MTLSQPGEALALAERAHGLVQASPAKARGLAELALRLAQEEHDDEARVAALHALGFARYVLGDERALATVRAAVRAGVAAGFDRRAALARRNVALYLAYRGRPREAIREIETARDVLRGIERARTEVFRIAVYGLAGRVTEVLPAAAPALRLLRERGDAVWEARLRYNRAAARGELGDHTGAHEDLERARELYGALGLGAAVADVRVELARLSLANDDELGCLRELDSLDPTSLSDWGAAWLYLLRAEAELTLRLLPEARADLRRFEAAARKAGAADAVNTARLHAAALSLAAGDLDAATSLAASARRSYAARGQPVLAAATATITLGAAVARGNPSSDILRMGKRAAGPLSTAERELAAALPLARRGNLPDRISLQYVSALAHLRRDDSRAARRALAAGLRLLEDRRATFGAIELRAAASALGEELCRAGVALAIASGRPGDALDWAERLRANALREPLARPPARSTVRLQQAELRRVTRELERARGARVAELAGRRTELEALIRARTRLVRGSGASLSPRVEGAASAALRDCLLIEYIENDGRIAAVTHARGRSALHDLADADALAELDWLRLGLRRLAANRRGDHAAVDAAAAALDRHLVAPLLRGAPDAPVVIVPTGSLYAMPWGMLPSLRARVVTIAPSLGLWSRLASPSRRRSSARKTVLVAGPRLRHAVAEVEDLAVLRPDATVLRGGAATAVAVLAALDGAALAHVACHGRFRSDAPLFSSLELADGPLTALDLQGMRRPPEVLVLSACDLALSERRPGDELLGVAAALLAMGTRTVVASVVPVHDAGARRLMAAFHRELLDAPPATALAHAQAAVGAGSASVAGFVCLGSG